MKEIIIFYNDLNKELRQTIKDDLTPEMINNEVPIGTITVLTNDIERLFHKIGQRLIRYEEHSHVDQK